MVNYTGIEWLLIDLASQWGLDKDLYPKRIQWAQELLPHFKVETLAELKSNLSAWIQSADAKPQFVGAAIAIWDAYKGVASNWTVSQDSASSGAQLMSCLMRCETGMRNTGVLGSSFPDLYGTVNKGMAQGGLDIPRNVLKKGMIPHMYKSVAAPQAVFGDNYPLFLASYSQAVPMAQVLSDALADSWDSNALEHTFLYPDGFEAVIPVIITEEKEVPYGKHKYSYRYQKIGAKEKGKAPGTKANAANAIHGYDGYMLRELDRRCNYDAAQIGAVLQALENPTKGPIDLDKATKLKHLERLAKYFKQVSLVAIEYVTPSSAVYLTASYRKELIKLLTKVLENPTFEVKTVHDDFACLPNHVNTMKRHYNRLLQESYHGEWAYRTIEKLTGRQVNIPTPCPVIAEQILEAEFAIS